MSSSIKHNSKEINMQEVFEFAIEGTFIIIGMIEWLKNLNIKNIKKYAPYISLLMSIVLGFAAATTYEKLTIWNVISCSGIILAMTQLGYQAIVESICGAIDRFLNKNNTETKTDKKDMTC